jgi:hypothetical protein
MRDERECVARAWRVLIGIAAAMSCIANVGAEGAAEIIAKFSRTSTELGQLVGDPRQFEAMHGKREQALAAT